MNIEQLEQQVIVNEWQLGQQLNTAVRNGTREKFNLLLSFLSDDARDFAQFEVKPNAEDDKKEIDLRSYFKLPATQPLINEGPSEVLLAEFNEDLQATKMVDIKFKQLLINEAILCKKVEESLPADILDNLSLIKKQRVNSAYQDSLPSVNTLHSFSTGVDASLLDEYKKLTLEDRPLQVHYL